MKIDLEMPGATNTTPKPVATEQPNEPSAAEQLETAQHPKKSQQPPEMLSPQTIALMNSQTKAAVAEAISGLMEKLLPTFEKLAAPSPAETAALRKEQELEARNAREWSLQKVQIAETRIAERQKQANCSHLDSNGHERLNLVHNFPDHQARAFCSACSLWLHPREYRVLPPSVRTLAEAEKFIAELVKQGEISGATPFVDPKTGIATHFLVEPHALYYRVKAIESRNSMGII
jgi:hypothetical protein